jgi:hypothetical protein
MKKLALDRKLMLSRNELGRLSRAKRKAPSKRG